MMEMPVIEPPSAPKVKVPVLLAVSKSDPETEVEPD